MALQTVTLTSTVPSLNWTVPSDCFIVNAFLVGGGGGGGSGNGTINGGGGGGGGNVRYITGISVTPGGTVTYTVGTGGAAGFSGGTTTFGANSVSGGANGTFFGTGGASSSLIVSTTTNYNGGSQSGLGGGGAGSGSNGINGSAGGFGGNGYIFNGTSYGGGGGGGGATFAAGDPRPVPSAYGGQGGGGQGGSEGPGSNGTPNTGGGGGGGSAGGTLTSKGTLASYLGNPTPTAPNLTLAAQNGGSGGSGIIILTYDEATFTITTSAPGVAEGSPITITLSTRNVANGSVLPYTITGVAAADFSPATLTGNFTVSSTDGGLTGTASVTLTMASDAVTEGNETAVISLNNGFATKVFTVGDSSITSGPAVILSKKIQIADYNAIQNDVASVMGSGSADYGYGQTMLSSQVSVANKVTINEWGNLRYDIINAWVHQFGSIPSPVTAVEGELVKANSSTSPYSSYQTFANVLLANRFGVHSSQAITRTGPSAGVFWSAQQAWPGIYGASWTTKIQSTVTVAFTNASKARAFFNSGSEIRFIATIAGGSATQQNAAWTTLLNGVGTVAFGGIKPGLATEPNDGQNFYRLSSTYQYFYTASSTSPYSANTYRIAARTPAVADNSSGTASTIEFLVEWLDSHPGVLAYDAVDGTATLAINTLEASGTLQPSGTGNFSVETPTITVGAITP